MPLSKKVSFYYLLPILFFFTLVQCSSPEKQVIIEPQGYKFYYYPKLNAYYDFSRDSFVYTFDGGQTWLSKKPASDSLTSSLGDKVLFYCPIPQAWLSNAQHRQQYNGVLADFIDEKALAVEAAERERILAKQKTATAEKVDSPELKKKDNFFKRLKGKLKRRDKKEE